MKRFIASLSISLVLSLGFVFAHSEFESSTPEDGAVLTTAPSEIVINFEKDIQPNFSVFKVYLLPADMIADAATMDASGHSEGEAEHSETSSDSGTTTEGEHSEGEAHSEEGGEHSAMDAAAKLFIPTVIDLSGDEDARADTGIVAADTAKSVTINLKETLAPGAYVAMFRVLSADTHTVEGFITFEIKPE
jgi:copper resistance protein C